MMLESALQSWCRVRRLKDRLGETSRILDGKPDDLGSLDCPTRRFMGSGDHEIREASSLDLGGTLEHGHHLGGQARFQTGNSSRFIHAHYIRQIAGYFKRSRSSAPVGLLRCRGGGTGAWILEKAAAKDGDTPRNALFSESEGDHPPVLPETPSAAFRKGRSAAASRRE
jgi:hypothetical protein